MGDLSGTTVDGKYELLRQIGQGGMGAVYEARSRTTRKRCAVKLLLAPERAGDADSMKRFVREARAGGLIESEHVLAAFDSGIDASGHPYYVMDFLEGEDLEKTLHRLRLLAPVAASKIALQAALGLVKAHELGIVHRDVKPANLFLVPGDEGEITVKLLDFGIAKVRHEDFDESSATVTRTGSMLGTPRYMSPEQVRRASKIDASADVWSLGVVLFECLCGRHPWDDTESLGTLMAAILTSEIPHIQDRAPWIQPELADIVERALSRDPDRRLRTAAELRDALRALLPMGARLKSSELIAPADTERLSVAPRKARNSSVGLETTLRQSVSGAYRSVPTATRTGPVVTAFGVAVGLVAVGGTALVLARNPETPALPSEAAPVPTTSEQPAPARRRFLLEVAPAGIAVSVNGTPRTVSSGKVPIEGPLGSAHTVRLTHGGATLESRIALTAEGLIPPRLELPAAPAASATPVASLAARKKPAPSAPTRPASLPADEGRAAPATSAVPATVRLDDKFD